MAGTQDYWDALERLVSNTPNLLPKGSKISKDNVAIEAGRKRGSIKKSRESFAELIRAIEEAAAISVKKNPDIKIKLKNERSQKLHYREMYHKALNRELMLIEQLSQLEKQLKQCGNVTPIK